MPSLVEKFKNLKIKNMKCGSYHSYIQTTDNNHYLFGKNNYNQCLKTHSNRIKLNESMKPIKFLNKQIKSVHLGNDCTMIIFEKYSNQLLFVVVCATFVVIK